MIMKYENSLPARIGIPLNRRSYHRERSHLITRHCRVGRLPAKHTVQKGPCACCIPTLATGKNPYQLVAGRNEQSVHLDATWYGPSPATRPTIFDTRKNKINLLTAARQVCIYKKNPEKCFRMCVIYLVPYSAGHYSNERLPEPAQMRSHNLSSVTETKTCVTPSRSAPELEHRKDNRGFSQDHRGRGTRPRQKKKKKACVGREKARFGQNGLEKIHVAEMKTALFWYFGSLTQQMRFYPFTMKTIENRPETISCTATLRFEKFRILAMDTQTVVLFECI
jgi:hypothetical protein